MSPRPGSSATAVHCYAFIRTRPQIGLFLSYTLSFCPKIKEMEKSRIFTQNIWFHLTDAGLFRQHVCFSLNPCAHTLNGLHRKWRSKGILKKQTKPVVTLFILLSTQWLWQHPLCLLLIYDCSLVNRLKCMVQNFVPYQLTIQRSPKTKYCHLHIMLTFD